MAAEGAVCGPEGGGGRALFPAAAAARGMKMYNFNIGDPNKWDFETPEYFKETLRQAVDNTDNGYGDKCLLHKQQTLVGRFLHITGKGKRGEVLHDDLLGQRCEP